MPTSGATMDLEYGFSCMGYEVAGPWGAAMARGRTHPDGLVTSIFGDGSYLMLNSELFSAAFAGHPFVAVLCDNDGYAVIHRLQTGQGADGFQQPARRLPAGPARTAGARRLRRARPLRWAAASRTCRPAAGVEGLRAAYCRGPRRPRAPSHGPAVVVCRVHPSDLDRVGRLVGDRRARVAVRPRVVRRGQGATGPLDLKP